MQDLALSALAGNVLLGSYLVGSKRKLIDEMWYVKSGGAPKNLTTDT